MSNISTTCSQKEVPGFFLLVVTLFIRIIVHDMEENPAKLCKIHVLVASSTNQPIQVCILKPDSGLEKGWIRMRIRICCAAHLNVHEALRQHSTAALRAAIFGAAMSVPCSRQRKEWHATKEWDAPGGVRDTTRWPNPNLGWKCDKIH